MDVYNVPIGFGIALARNAEAMDFYSAMPENEKQEILAKAHNAWSDEEMHQLVSGIVKH